MARLTVPAVEVQLRRLKGNMSAVARHFRVTRQAVHKFVNHHPSLKDTVNDARESLVDKAESKIDTAVGKGQPWAVSLVLKTLGKGRGWVEKTELDVTERTRQRVVEDVVDEDRGEARSDPPGAAEVPPEQGPV